MRRGVVVPAAVGLLVACLVAGVGAGVAPAFKIDRSRTFLGGLFPHGGAGGGVHEQITAKAIKRGMPDAAQRLVAHIQAGAENVDVTHHFDAEYHFDSASTRTYPRRFALGFQRLNSHLNGARPLADRNPEFFEPSFGSYRAIVGALPAALRQLAGDPDCDGCDRPRLRRLADEFAKDKRLKLALAVNGNPDPHPPTNPRSAFGTVSAPGCGLCGKLAGIRKEYLTLMTRVNRAVAFAKAQSGRLDETSPARRSVQKISDALRAYRAFQALGHAFHAAQDFFAHSNYVELMAGVDVEQPIRKGTTIPVPQRRADFGPRGLRAIMGAQRYRRLESGSAAAIWLGEGDFCLGSPYNPDTRFTFTIDPGLARLLGVPGRFSTPRKGRNPRPPKGLNYCHYASKTVDGVRTPGLNKDEPGSKEPSHVNHSFARQAAEDMTAVLWKSFLSTIRKPDAPAPGTWTGTWVQGYGTTGQPNMVLIQTGNKVKGCYERENSTITGTVDGNVLDGTWTNREGGGDNTGPLEFVLKGDSFTGRWAYEKPLGTSVNWSGTRVSRKTDASGICDLP